MANLNVHVAANAGKTVSGFGVSQSGKVIFENNGAKELTIIVKDPPAPTKVLCEKKNGDGPTSTFTVAAGGSEDFFICPGYEGQFTYSAQIEDTIIEDPIIIIQRDNFDGFLTGTVLAAGTGIVAGVALTLVAQRLFARRRPG